MVLPSISVSLSPVTVMDWGVFQFAVVKISWALLTVNSLFTVKEPSTLATTFGRSPKAVVRFKAS